MVSANFVIPYPPGFPIMVPGQVIAADTIGFMRKLDVKEIHGYNATRGLKLIKLSAIATEHPSGPGRNKVVKLPSVGETRQSHSAPAGAAPVKRKTTAK
jgi:hypothetical protein